MKRVFVCKINNSAHLEAIIKNLGKSIEQYKVKLVIVDSVIPAKLLYYSKINLYVIMIFYVTVSALTSSRDASHVIKNH